MFNHIVQIGQRALQFPAVDRLGGFPGVFEGDAEVGAVGAGGFALLDCGSCVADLRLRRGVSWVSDGVRLCGGLGIELAGYHVAGGLETATAAAAMDEDSVRSWRGSLPSCTSLRRGC